MDRRILIKTGVWFKPVSFVSPEVMRIIAAVETTTPMGYSPTITSAADGTHKAGSKHYLGKAFDFRINDLPEGIEPKRWASRIQSKLGDDYFVLLEDTHIHIQWNG